MEVMKPIEFDPTWLQNINVSLHAVDSSMQQIISKHSVKKKANMKAWALKALTLTDLTTLAGDDTEANVRNLVIRAAYPFPAAILDALGFKTAEEKHFIHTAAVCVYPSRVKNALEQLTRMGKDKLIPIAAVATGFPSGQYSLESRLKEIEFAISNGATEIDIVINRELALNGKWAELYDELLQMRRACGSLAHMKSILAIGELGTMKNVYIASMVAMMAGSDFIKTSTGKESVNATLPIGLVMIRAIQNFHARTGKRIGLKPAGGVRTVKEAIPWMILIKETLGDDWLQPELFRFGASGLLNDIESIIYS